MYEDKMAFVILIFSLSLATHVTAKHFNPERFHRTAADSADGHYENSFTVQMPECLEKGGVCTSSSNCPTDHYLKALEPLCGDQMSTVCCKPTRPLEENVIQVDACNQEGAFCTWSSICPPESRLDNPLLCGDQADVTCCTTGLAKKRTVKFSMRDKFLEVEADNKTSIGENEINFGEEGSNFRRKKSMLGKIDTYFDKHDSTSGDSLIADGSQGLITKRKSPAYHQKRINKAEFILKRSSDANTLSHDFSSSEKPNVVEESKEVRTSGALGVAKRQPRGNSCVEVRGLCVRKQDCPEGDLVGDQGTCGDEGIIACCRLSAHTISVENFPYFGYPKDGKISGVVMPS
ncbi:uncharacterized protein LOC108671397 [Hyalella azteca]|uniref:Uncharacterized protein LOC108671397 n=1 Tax=Hyalella azteca TaxID=294128 RepID=A0A8B7NL90_HYAAZ|nr:uncharacterized protein LOC108671397 [Hyalella azteca]